MEAIINGEETTLIIKCVKCGTIHALGVKTYDWVEYKNGDVLIQNAFPYLNAGERELILTGICDNCFNQMFKDDDEPEENMPESYEYNNRD